MEQLFSNLTFIMLGALLALAGVYVLNTWKKRSRSQQGSSEMLAGKPLIRLVERDGKLVTLDNKLLEAYRRAGTDAPYRMATDDEIAANAWKFTSKDPGSIRVRVPETFEQRDLPPVKLHEQVEDIQTRSDFVGRYLRAIETLARVRRLTRPNAVQINVAHQQINTIGDVGMDSGATKGG
jgi:hypothetical protein